MNVVRSPFNDSLRARAFASAILLGALSSATAAVVYVPGFASFDNFLTNQQSVVPADLTGDGQADLHVKLGSFGAGLVTTPGWQLSGIDMADLGYAYPPGRWSFTMLYHAGEIIGSDSTIVGVQWFSHNINSAAPSDYNSQITGSELLGYNPRVPGAGDGAWFLANEGYAGFRFLGDDGEWRYGWVRIEIARAPFSGVPEKGNGQHFYFSEWAWETEANKPIAAGAIPEPSGPFISACIAVMMTFRRRRRDLSPKKNPPSRARDPS